MSADDGAPWRHLLDQADRCLEDGDAVGAEVHLTAALERARERDEGVAEVEALLRLGRLRRSQRRRLAAERRFEEARQRLASLPSAPQALRAALEAAAREDA